MPIDGLLIVFKLVLFVLLVYKVTQLVRAYLIPLLKEELDLERKQQTELFEREKLLISTQHRLENQINSQKKTFTCLDKNVQTWQMCLLAQKEENERSARNIIAQLDDKRKIQQHYLALAKDSATIIPATCEQAAEQLTQEFKDSEHGRLQLALFIKELACKKVLTK